MMAIIARRPFADTVASFSASGLDPRRPRP
jgi:hypothetical protein